MPSDNNKKDFDPVYSRRAENKPHYKQKNQKKRRMIGWSIFAILLIVIGSGLIWGLRRLQKRQKDL